MIRGLLIGFVEVHVIQIRIVAVVVAVAQATRGKGVGRALLAEMEHVARERGCEAVSLEVREDNEPAVSLYRRDGYQLLGETKSYYSDGATALHFMKSLGQVVLR